MPRTTIDLDLSVLRELRRRGLRERKSMGAVASELLVRALDETAHSPETAALDWRSGDLGKPKVDLEDKEALHATLGDGR